jgi:hypothetical protein
VVHASTSARTLAPSAIPGPGGATSLSVDDDPTRLPGPAVRCILRATGLLDHAPFETRVAWVRDLFERIDVDGVRQRAVPRWKAPTDQDVDRLESVTEWLRR